VGQDPDTVARPKRIRHVEREARRVTGCSRWPYQRGLRGPLARRKKTFASAQRRFAAITDTIGNLGLRPEAGPHYVSGLQRRPLRLGKPVLASLTSEYNRSR